MSVTRLPNISVWTTMSRWISGEDICCPSHVLFTLFDDYKTVNIVIFWKRKAIVFDRGENRLRCNELHCLLWHTADNTLNTNRNRKNTKSRTNLILILEKRSRSMFYEQPQQRAILRALNRVNNTKTSDNFPIRGHLRFRKINETIKLYKKYNTSPYRELILALDNRLSTRSGLLLVVCISVDPRVHNVNVALLTFHER